MVGVDVMGLGHHHGGARWRSLFFAHGFGNAVGQLQVYRLTEQVGKRIGSELLGENGIESQHNARWVTRCILF